MSDYIFKKYEENKSFEEYQAEIYNAVAKKFNAQTVTAEAINKRLHDHRPEQDRNGMTFAFDKTGKAVAYIQYREYAQGKVRIGYPWAIDGVPQSVKDEMFNNLLNYLKEKYPETKKFYLGFVNNAFKDIIEDIKNHYSFKENESFSSFSLSILKASKLKLPNEYQFKEATEHDFNLLVEISMSDSILSKMGEERIRDFFNKRYFSIDNKDRISLILLKHDKPIGFVGLAKTTDHGNNYSTVRISAIQSKEEYAYEYLISATAKFLESNSWNDPIVFNFDKSEQKYEEIVKNLGGQYISKAFEFVLEIK